MYRVIEKNADPFAPAISRFVQMEFPQQIVPGNGDLLEILSTTIMGTKQTRYGPKPAPEGQVAIRDVIRKYTALGEPIPFMVPWGSQKPDSTSVDVAELMAIRTLDCLHQRVRAYYDPGVVFNVRIEDASAPFLYKENAEQKRAGAARYVADMTKLTKVLDVRKHIRMMPEGSRVTEAKFAEEAEQHWKLMLDKIKTVRSGIIYKAHDPLNAELEARGWKGGINPETIEFYLERYSRLYPNRDEEYNTGVLARYFATALARKRLGVRGDCPAWEGSFIDMSFAPIVPGTDAHFARRVQYRTMPSTLTRNHMAPWRSKGYLAIADDGTVEPQLAHMNEERPYNENVTVIERDGLSVEVRTDYINS